MKTIKHITVTEQPHPVTLSQLPTLRLTFGIAACILLVGVTGTYFISPYFLLLPVLVSGGLTLAATFGVCPMTAIIEALRSRLLTNSNK